ncbi:response regulator transcription factor [Winogradskyella aurantiaca]|uniref:response regulator transcription factor n=1 Tax=Winogradskyella aurantiaca TaxID=2219558 RepID=UPI001E63410B|nr:LuxR C-terminal-related transcriptional regulator [Winogradskyella aurantiaca]
MYYLSDFVDSFMRKLLALLFLGIVLQVHAQYHFSGYVDPGEDAPSVYLSVVEDYRQLNGIYNDQIITRTTADSTGYFEFKGNLLEDANRIYRIHSDYCNEIQDGKGFGGFCPNSYAVVFIAKNTDTLSLPYGFEKQIFCDIESNNPKATALIKIDSLKEEMRFAYSEYRSDANKKLNDKKWFATLQDFSKAANEPLAELYTYAYLSDRSNDIYRYYVEDLKTNNYYQDLHNKLLNSYPNTSYTRQYARELQADRFMLASTQKPNSETQNLLLYTLLALSLILNTVLLFRLVKKKRHRSKNLKAQLSKQEQAVLELLLENKSNKDIADALFVSVSTVKSHTNSIYKKLEVNSRDGVKSLFN